MTDSGTSDLSGEQRPSGMSDYVRSLRAKVGNELLMGAAAGTLIFDRVGRVLLVRHSEGNWTNPGGLIEPFETPADAAVRETWEEIGVRVELTRLVGIFGGGDHHIVYRNGDEFAYVAVIFEARILEGSPVPDGHEVLELGYFTREEALALDLMPQKRRHLEAGFDRPARGYFDPPMWVPPRR